MLVGRMMGAFIVGGEPQEKGNPSGNDPLVVFRVHIGMPPGRDGQAAGNIRCLVGQRVGAMGFLN